jgi:hypothetical protein
MKNTLFKVNHFCTVNGIDYVLTGTAALSVLGIPLRKRPADLDILIVNPNRDSLNKLKDLESLSGITPVKYPGHKCFTFYVNGDKVNAIISESIPEEDLITTRLIDKQTEQLHFIKVHRVHPALQAKMRLGRPKDSRFMFEFINYLTSL